MNIIVPLFLQWKALIQSFALNIMEYPSTEIDSIIAEFFSKRTYSELDDDLLLYFAERFDTFKRIFQHYPATPEGIQNAYREFKNMSVDDTIEDTMVDQLQAFLTVWNNE